MLTKAETAASSTLGSKPLFCINMQLKYKLSHLSRPSVHSTNHNKVQLCCSLWLVACMESRCSASLTPYWSVLDFWKIKLEKSSSTDCLFSLQKSISKLIFAGYTGSKNPVQNRLKIQFVILFFSKLIIQKSSTF